MTWDHKALRKLLEYGHENRERLGIALGDLPPPEEAKTLLNASEEVKYLQSVVDELERDLVKAENTIEELTDN